MRKYTVKLGALLQVIGGALMVLPEPTYHTIGVGAMALGSILLGTARPNKVTSKEAGAGE